MLEEIRKGLLAGFGAVLLSKEKIEEVISKLVDEAKLNKEEAQKLKDELFTTGERQWKESRGTI